MKDHSKTFYTVALIMFVVAVLRWFMKGWMDSLGLPELLGSFLASINIVVLIGMIVLFASEGRGSEPRYWRAAGWWIGLAAWEQILIVPGILLAGRTGASTYYSEMVGAHRELPPVQHAISHGVAFFFVAALGLLLGWLVFWIAKRGRPAGNAGPVRT